MKKICVLFLVLVLTVLCFSGCAKPEKQILGKWNGEANLLGVVTEYAFEFNEDGSGKMTTALDIGLATTYTISDTQLDITTSVLGIENTKSYIYAFDKDTLTLTEIGTDTTIVLTKEK